MKKNLRKRNVLFELPEDMVDAIEAIDFAVYAFRPGSAPKYKKEAKIGEFRSDCIKFIHQLLKDCKHRLEHNHLRWNKSKPSSYFETVYGRYYHDVIKCLTDAGILECDGMYIAKKENLVDIPGQSEPLIPAQSEPPIPGK